MSSKAFYFYVALGMQLVGITSVSLCLYSGLMVGDYGRLELVQFVGGAACFYIGSWFKGRS